jgi:hypothetical protein
VDGSFRRRIHSIPSYPSTSRQMTAG